MYRLISAWQQPAASPSTRGAADRRLSQSTGEEATPCDQSLRPGATDVRLDGEITDPQPRPVEERPAKPRGDDVVRPVQAMIRSRRGPCRGGGPSADGRVQRVEIQSHRLPAEPNCGRQRPSDSRVGPAQARPDLAVGLDEEDVGALLADLASRHEEAAVRREATPAEVPGESGRRRCWSEPSAFMT